jgi:hypothetical protein
VIRRTWIQVGMPVTVCIRDEGSGEQDVSAVASWFENVNQHFSTCLECSEVCRLNAGAIVRNDVSSQLEEVCCCSASRRTWRPTVTATAMVRRTSPAVRQRTHFATPVAADDGSYRNDCAGMLILHDAAA